jgi:hypothetical protein
MNEEIKICHLCWAGTHCRGQMDSSFTIPCACRCRELTPYLGEPRTALEWLAIDEKEADIRAAMRSVERDYLERIARQN